jgi:hypothetical protein
MRRDERPAASAGGLAGAALLVVSTDVAPEDEADFNDWYNREHIDDLLRLPGFRRARRYGSAGAPPRFLAVYEVEEIGALAAPVYLDLLADQSAWSRSIIARFTSHERLCCRVSVDAAHGLGGALGVARLAGAGEGDGFRHHLATSVFPELIARFDLHGAVFAENDLDVVNAPARLRGVGFAEAREPQSLILVEGGDLPPVDAALEALRTALAASLPDAGRHLRSTRSYRMLYANGARG